MIKNDELQYRKIKLNNKKDYWKFNENGFDIKF